MHYNVKNAPVPASCQISHKTVVHGHNVSHANNKTKRTFKPNLRYHSLNSAILGTIRVRATTNGLRTIYKHGGIDQYLLTQKLSDPDLVTMKKRLQKAMAAKETAQ